MAAIASDIRSWNWLRVGAWSGTFALHVLVLMLVAAPVLVPMPKAAQEPIVARWIAPEKPLALPEPPPPTVPRHVRVPVHVPSPATPPIPDATQAATPIDIVTKSRQSDEISAVQPSSPNEPASGGATQTLAYATPLHPRYPPASAREHEQGTVLLRVLVDASGVPQRIEIARSSGHARLDAAARDSVLQARFRPVLREGAAVSAWGLVPIEFRLDRG
jgi:protein TonB